MPRELVDQIRDFVFEAEAETQGRCRSVNTERCTGARGLDEVAQNVIKNSVNRRLIHRHLDDTERKRVSLVLPIRDLASDGVPLGKDGNPALLEKPVTETKREFERPALLHIKLAPRYAPSQ